MDIQYPVSAWGGVYPSPSAHCVWRGGEPQKTIQSPNRQYKAPTDYTKPKKYCTKPPKDYTKT